MMVRKNVLRRQTVAVRCKCAFVCKIRLEPCRSASISPARLIVLIEIDQSEGHWVRLLTENGIKKIMEHQRQKPRCTQRVICIYTSTAKEIKRAKGGHLRVGVREELESWNVWWSEEKVRRDREKGDLGGWEKAVEKRVEVQNDPFQSSEVMRQRANERTANVRRNESRKKRCSSEKDLGQWHPTWTADIMAVWNNSKYPSHSPECSNPERTGLQA